MSSQLFGLAIGMDGEIVLQVFPIVEMTGADFTNTHPPSQLFGLAISMDGEIVLQVFPIVEMTGADFTNTVWNFPNFQF